MKPLKTETTIFMICTIFFLIVTPIYWFMAHEPAGATALALTIFVFAMIWGLMAATARKIDVRPEDNRDAEVVEGAGELGFFPPKSIWPLWCALTLSIMLLGPVFGWWLTILGAGIGIWAVCGWIYEFYKGDYAH